MTAPRLFLLAATASLIIVPARASDPLQVKTAQGKVEGTLTPDGKVRAFRGIPFAAPPVGDLRWQPPQPPARFHGTLAAKDFGHRCIQTHPFGDMIFHDPGESEDCLTLNIWTPADAKPGKLPVMIWIYGGGFLAGSTSEGRQDGQFLAHRNVIIVSMNYRMGIFGFFVHPELTAESPHHASGNYGLLDQAAAIAWVKQNIRGFGGDPANITLFGESAGSFSVALQMASPLSRNSLAKAIGESGAPFSLTLPYKALAEREQADAAFARTAYDTDSLPALRKLSAQQVLAGATTPGVHPFGPVVDGYFLPIPVPEIYAAGQQAHIPLLAGWNADEARPAPNAPNQPTAASFAAQAAKDFGPDAETFLALYPATTDEEALRSAGDLAGDRFIEYRTWRWLEAQVASGSAPVFRYRLDLGSPGDRYHSAALGAFHSDDIEYVFGTLDARPDAVWRPEDRQLSELMQQYWTNFARTGDPNGPGLPAWPTYSAPNGWQVMHLDRVSQATPDTHRERYLFLERTASTK
jgi:para-nitrobenzyl esterase